MDGDGEVQEAVLADAGIWVNVEGFAPNSEDMRNDLGGGNVTIFFEDVTGGLGQGCFIQSIVSLPAVGVIWIVKCYSMLSDRVCLRAGAFLNCTFDGPIE